MNDKKYELLPAETSGPHTGLHRIRALRDIPRHYVLKGDLGGYVSSEANLSQLDSVSCTPGPGRREPPMI